MKLLKEVQQQKCELAERDQILNEQRIAYGEHKLQETRLQVTISQQSKLINHLQEMGSTPEPKGLEKIRKVGSFLKSEDMQVVVLFIPCSCAIAEVEVWPQRKRFCQRYC